MQFNHILKNIKTAAMVIAGLLWMGTLISCQLESDAVREKIEFNADWKFELGDSTDYRSPSYNDEGWDSVDLPHDWSIAGEFDASNPAGPGGGYLPGGVGWYRKTFTLPEEDADRRIYITFDGVYQNSEVYINGELLGKRPNGYITFQYDLTPHLKFGNAANTLAVRADNSDQPNSRWYSGSGIYRNVWLEKMSSVHVDLWGTHVTTPEISKTRAEVEIETVIRNMTPDKTAVTLETRILDAEEKTVAQQTDSLTVDPQAKNNIGQKMILASPKLWDIERPYLYKAVSIIRRNDAVLDRYETRFGVRYFNFYADKGFFLNGRSVKIKGVCNHHDLGALGSALNLRARERQLEILKKMGCNAIRTSHNPPSPELLELCDRMGFIVQNETFDAWAISKVANDYAKYWDPWHVRDLTDHLMRDRNHPSIFSWSIGNEILEQWDPSGTSIAQELADLVRQYAPGIPITAGLNDPGPHNYILQSNALDLIGFNYNLDAFESFPVDYPGEKFIATETTSALATRGQYDMPSDEIRRWPYRWDEPFLDGNPDQSCSSYDNCSTPWGSTHAESWRVIKANDYLSGMFVWTGFDYIGEPTPYVWPSRSSYFGIIDLAGFPKDAYYLYQSEWTESPVLHLFPHWNWQSGDTVDVWAYTNFDEVELFLNGKSLGTQTKTADQFHLTWPVAYEPGTLTAVGRNQDGKTKEVTIHTAGAPAKIRLQVDRNRIGADGKDLAFVTASVLDKDGNIVPTADNLIRFSLSGPLSIAGVDNGSQTSHEPFTAARRKAFNGKCLAILKSEKKAGSSIFKATSEGLQGAAVKIISR